MFKSIQAAAATVGQPQRSIDDTGIKRVFMVLHGFYGNLFLSKFATGSLENGEDQGIANARKVWAYSLSEYDAETIKGALRRCQQQHPEYPPSLPQFVGLCSAIKPRESYQAPAHKALPMSPELRQKIVAERRAAAKAAAAKVLEAPQESGLNLLKQAIARAVAEAGGDEVAALLRLDRMLAPKVAA